MSVPGGRSNGLRYLNVADSLKQSMLDGKYKPGDSLPNQRCLATEFNVSTATIRRALDVLDEAGLVVRKPGQGACIAAQEGPRPTALVVDDDDSVRDFLRKALTNSGWECVNVATGYDALEKLRKGRFALVFLDLVMAGLNGAETFREIRRIDADVYVVIVTGYPDSALISQTLHTALMSEALEVGPFELIAKPINLEALRTVLRLVTISSEIARSTA